MNEKRFTITGRDIAIALSLANLCFARLWAEIFCVSDPRNSYFLKVANVDFLAAALNVLMLAGMFLLAVEIARRFGRPGKIAIIAGFVAVLAHQLHFIDGGNNLDPGAFTLFGWWEQGRWANLAGIAAALGTVAFLCWRWPKKALRVATNTIYAFSPFLLVTFGRAAWILATVNPAAAFASKAPPIDAKLPESAGPRVVVLIFDAIGHGLAIDHRPEGFTMPELDRLRAESIDASQITQAGPLTKISIPAIVSGVPVALSKPRGQEMILTIGTGESARKESWTTLPTLFQGAQQAGGVAVVAGWYHPYCRLFPDLDACAWYPALGSSQGQDTGLFETMRDQEIGALLPYVNRPYRQISNFRREIKDARVAVVQGGKGLVFVHLIVAHHPWIWNAKKEAFSVTNFGSGPDGFFDQLALVDRTLGELRREMEAAGKWRDTTVLVTSDHFSRPDRARDPNDKRVPWILKVAGQEQGRAYDRPLSAVTTHPLVLALLRGEVADADQAIAWLDAHGIANQPAVAVGNPDPTP